MSTRKRYDIVEFLKRDDYRESSSSSGSKKGERVARRPRKLKTLPQAEWHEMDKVMADLKATLPNIGPEEVRRFYIPYHEAILLELEEQKYEEAARRLKELLEFDERINEKSLSVSRWKKLCLKDQKDFVDRLRDGLIEYERAKRNGTDIGDHVARATSLLDIALFFESKRWEWWWVADRLYRAALTAAEDIEGDDRYTITLIRYLYGRFLFQRLQNPKEALIYLNEAREASEKKTWNASKKLGEKQSFVFIECNILLYEALLVLARQERPENPKFALEICTEALQRATDAGNNEYVNEVLYELGKSFVATKNVKRALQSFSKLLAIAKRIPDVEGVCNAHMELAFAYKQLDDDVHTEKHLRLFCENAEKFGLAQKLADAHYYSGEHYLSRVDKENTYSYFSNISLEEAKRANEGKLDLSTAHLESALCLYNKLGLSREADRARSIAGISKDDKSDLEIPYENSEGTISSVHSFLNG